MCYTNQERQNILKAVTETFHPFFKMLHSKCYTVICYDNTKGARTAYFLLECGEKVESLEVLYLYYY